MPALIYLPDGYADGALKYPVAYLLHGAGGNETVWLRHGNILSTMDALIAKRAVPPSILVMPGCHGCWWIDGAKERAESAFWRDLVPTIERNFRTIRGRQGMVLVGQSAGGYGVVRYAMRYPDRVGAVAALSPAVYAVTPPPASSARSQPPFLDRHGVFDQNRWAQNNYPLLIESYFRQQHKVPFYLVSGDGDRLGIAFETALLFKQLFDKQPSRVELRVLDGRHSWKLWRKAVDGAMTYALSYAARPVAATPKATVAVSRLRPARAINVWQIRMRELRLCNGSPASGRYSLAATDGDTSPPVTTSVVVWKIRGVIAGAKCLGQPRLVAPHPEPAPRLHKPNNLIHDVGATATLVTRQGRPH